METTVSDEQACSPPSHACMAHDDFWPFHVVAYSTRMAYHWKAEDSKHACSKRKWTRYERERKRESTRKRRVDMGTSVAESSEPSAEDLLQQVIHAFPEAALMRQQPQLDPNEWSTRTCHWQHLDSKGGIAICPKIHIPTVLQNVGWTKEPVGILTSENPDLLGLRGFPRQEVFCTYSIMAENAECKNMQVRKWLTQLGYGQFVAQKLFGPTVQLYSTMKEMIVKFSPRQQWPVQKMPANIIVEERSQIVPEHAISDVQPTKICVGKLLMPRPIL